MKNSIIISRKWFDGLKNRVDILGVSISKEDISDIDASWRNLIGYIASIETSFFDEFDEEKPSSRREFEGLRAVYETFFSR